MTGFNDFFFAIGILLLGSGIAFFTMGGADTWPRGRRRGDHVGAVRAAGAAYAAGAARHPAVGVLYFLRLSGGAGSICCRGSVRCRVSRSINPLYHTLFGVDRRAAGDRDQGPDRSRRRRVYYWRFRLPFALLPIAQLRAAIVSLVEWLRAMPRRRIRCSVSRAVWRSSLRRCVRHLRPRRVTRRADCAFWLHLLAAPLIVHSLISLINARLRPIIQRGRRRHHADRRDAGDRRHRHRPPRAAGVRADLCRHRHRLCDRGPSSGQSRTSTRPGVLRHAGHPRRFVITLGVGWMPLRRLPDRLAYLRHR